MSLSKALVPTAVAVYVLPCFDFLRVSTSFSLFLILQSYNYVECVSFDYRLNFDTQVCRKL